MIKIYGMNTCPTCKYVKEQAMGNDKYEIINLEDHARNLKEFLQLRDSNPIFDRVKEKGTIGIPCFVLEDGTVTFKPEDAGLKSQPKEAAPVVDEATEGKACSLDGKGC